MVFLPRVSRHGHVRVGDREVEKLVNAVRPATGTPCAGSGADAWRPALL